MIFVYGTLSNKVNVEHVQTRAELIDRINMSYDKIEELPESFVQIPHIVQKHALKQAVVILNTFLNFWLDVEELISLIRFH